MGLDALLKNQLCHISKCTYTLFLTQDVEIEHIFAFWAAVSEIMADFQNCHVWPWNLAIGQNSKSGTYTLFVTQGLEIKLILALRAAVSEILADFQNFHIWAWIPEVAPMLCFYPQGVEIELNIFALRAAVFEIRANFQNCHIWAWNLASGQSSRSCTYTLFLPQESKLSLFLLYYTGSGAHF